MPKETDTTAPVRPETDRLRRLGFGCGSIGNFGQKVSLQDALEAIREAYDAGIRYFDVAPLYGHGLGEHRLGAAIHEFRLCDLTISTKVGRILDPAPKGIGDFNTDFSDPLPFTHHFDYSYDAIMRSFEDSLQRMGVARIDILYIHNIDMRLHNQETCDRLFGECMNGGYRALERLRADGVVGAIGVGNNSWEMCRRFLDAGDFDLFLLPDGYNLLDQSGQSRFVDRCVDRAVGVVMGAPFATGVLAAPDAPGAMFRYAPATEDVRARARRISAIAADHGISLAAAALQFPLAHPAARAVLPGMKSLQEVAANCAAFATDIPAVFWEALKAEGLLPSNAHTPAPDAPLPLPLVGRAT